jgi:hypothetical protein
MSADKEGDELVEKLTKLAEKKESEPPPELTSFTPVVPSALTCPASTRGLPLMRAQRRGPSATR